MNQSIDPVIKMESQQNYFISEVIYSKLIVYNT